MDVSTGLFQIAGFFERYAKTGGVVSAVECRFLASQLGALAEMANAQLIAARAVAEEFDLFIEKNGGPVDQRPVRAFSVIDGGRSAAAGGQ